MSFSKKSKKEFTQELRIKIKDLVFEGWSLSYSLSVCGFHRLNIDTKDEEYLKLRKWYRDYKLQAKKERLWKLKQKQAG